MSALRGAARTDIGRVRSVNQDGALTSAHLVAVADGMGGHRAGEVASALALRSLAGHERFANLGEVVEAVQRANGSIFEAAAQEPDLRGMGTTLCALAVIDPQGPDERLALVNVGDSRAYQVRDGDLAQLTVDHSLVQLMVQEGQLRPDEAESHPQRNILTRALGIEHQVAVDGWQLDAVTGDRFLICSDGLFNEVEPGRIAATLRSYADPGEAARVLVGLANAAGGRDNVTCVVVDVVDAADPDEQSGDEAGAAAPATVTAGTAGASAGSSRRLRRGRNQRSAPEATDAEDRDADPDGRDADAKDADGKDGADGKDADGKEGDGGARPAPAPRSTVATAEHPAIRPSSGSSGAAQRSGGPPGGSTTTVLTSVGSHRRLDGGGDRAQAAERPPPRRFTLRVLLFLVAALAVLAVAVLAVGWFATRTYFVAFDGEQVAIFRGRPGGLLWIDPTVAEDTQPPLQRAGLVEALCDRVEGQPSATDLGDARRIVDQLRADQAVLPAPTSPCGAAR